MCPPLLCLLLAPVPVPAVPQARETLRVSVPAGGVEADLGSGRPALSEDGRFVAFESLAGTLVPGDTEYTIRP